MTDSLNDDLLDKEVHGKNCDLTITVVNLEIPFGDFMWSKHVLVELGFESRVTLRAAAASRDLIGIFNRLPLIESLSLFTDCQDSLVLYTHFFVV